MCFFLFFKNVATRTFTIVYVAHIGFLLSIAALDYWVFSAYVLLRWRASLETTLLFSVSLLCFNSFSVYHILNLFNLFLIHLLFVSFPHKNVNSIRTRMYLPCSFLYSQYLAYKYTTDQLHTLIYQSSDLLVTLQKAQREAETFSRSDSAGSYLLMPSPGLSALVTADLINRSH